MHGDALDRMHPRERAERLGVSDLLALAKPSSADLLNVGRRGAGKASGLTLRSKKLDGLSHEGPRQLAEDRAVSSARDDPQL